MVSEIPHNCLSVDDLRGDRQEAATIIHYFQTATEATVIPLTSDLLNSAIKMYGIYQDKTWGLLDCLSFVVMKKQQISIALAVIAQLR